MKYAWIQLLACDLQAQADFYGALLGLPIEWLVDGRLVVYLRHSRLIFAPTTAEYPAPYYHFAFNIPHNQLEGCIGWLRERLDLLPVEGGWVAEFEDWRARSVYFRDPSGNIAECIARFELSNAVEEPFSSDSFLSVSELGVVTDSVAALRQWLESATQVGVFSKQPASDRFAALGNDDGLLIVSAQGRHWYPTDIPARPFPAKAGILHLGDAADQPNNLANHLSADGLFEIAVGAF